MVTPPPDCLLSLLPEPNGHEAGTAVDAEFTEGFGDVLVGHAHGLPDLLGDLLFTEFGQQEFGDLALDGREGALGDQQAVAESELAVKPLMPRSA